MSPSIFPPNLRALFVGGTTGIGRAIALQLAHSVPGARIVVAGRSSENGQKVVQAAQQQGVDGQATASVEYKKVDCASLDDVRRFSKDVAEGLNKEERDGKKERLDLVVLSPGILTMRGRTETVDGIDFKMSLHYYARMLIIRELLSTESLSPNAIILSILDGKRSDPLSNAIKWDDMDLSHPNSYGLSSAAAHCCAFTDVQLSTFGKSNPGMTFIHAYPGVVDTPLLAGVIPKYMSWAVRPLVGMITISPETSSERLLKGVASAVTAHREGRGSKYMYSLDIEKLLDKKEVGDEMMDKVDKHTWGLVDGKR